MTKPPEKSKVVRKLRCAVYTRKSSEEGLEQEFNSLHAQREACEAYIASQRSEGWVLVRDQYDDGGISGGTLERPGLKRLLADIEDGLVDVVVVYKIDRLSRSLWVLNPMNTAARPTRLCIAATSCGISVIWTRCATTQPMAPPTATITTEISQLSAPGP
jgi:hypothetical protein